MPLFKRIKKTQRSPEIEAIWASALRAAAAVTRKASGSEEEVLHAVSEQLRRLKLTGGLTLLRPDGQLETRSRLISREAESTLQRLTGLQIAGFTFDPMQVEIYHQALSTGEAIFCPDRSQLVGQLIPSSLKPLLPRIMGILGNMPSIVAPLMLGDQPLGTINVNARWLTEDDIPMVAALADHIAIALGHARARTEMQASLTRERLRNQVAEALASALELPLVLERVIQLAAEVTGANAGAIGLIDSDGEVVSFPYIMNLPERLSLQPARRGSGIVWRLIEERTPIVLPEYGQDPDAIPSWVEAGVRSFLGVPLIAADEAIGGLGLFNLSKDQTFGEEQVEMAQAIGSMAAIAIRNARLYTDATHLAEESQALIRTARSISASLDHETVLQLIAEQAKALLEADGSRIHLADPESGTLRCLVALGPTADAVMPLELEIGQGITGYVAEHGVPVLLNDPASDPRGMHVPGTPEDEPECLALAPLKIRQRTMGVMTVRRLGINRPFTPSDLDLLTALAAQAAVALENAHLYSQIAAQALRLESEVAERTRDLALSESRYRALVETSLAGIFQLDVEGKVTYANQAFINLMQYKPEEVIGQYGAEGLAPEYRRASVNRFFASIRGEGPAREVYEVELLTRAGRRIPALMATSLITDDTGSPQGVTGLVLDISDRKTLEAALHMERDRLDAMLTNIGDAVIVTDPNGVIEYVNPSWERLNGFKAAEALGENPRIIQSGKHSPDFYAEMWETITNGKTWRGEVINARKDGSQYDAALTITPVLNEIGEVINYVGVQHDISALKELDRIKSQFVSDVSHELRTPLTNIRLYLDLLGRTAQDPERASRYLKTLSRESERLANLIAGTRRRPPLALGH